MFRKDYMVRQIEEFGKVLAALMNLRKNNDLPVFEKEIREALSRFTGMELSFVKSLTHDELRHYLSHSVQLHNDQLKILADLLWEDFLANEAQFEAEKEQLLKILSLYEMYQHALTQNEFNLEVHYKMSTIRNLLRINPPSRQ